MSTHAQLKGSASIIRAIGTQDTVTRLIGFVAMLGEEKDAIAANKNCIKTNNDQSNDKGTDDTDDTGDTDDTDEMPLLSKEEQDQRNKLNKLKKWDNISKEAEERKKLEYGQTGDVDMTVEEIDIALRALVESSAGLLLSILSTPAGCRTALASSTVVSNLLHIAKKASVLCHQEGTDKDKELQKLRLIQQNRMQQNNQSHNKQKQQLHELASLASSTVDLGEEETDDIALTLQRKLQQLHDKNERDTKNQTSIFQQNYELVKNVEQYGSRIYKWCWDVCGLFCIMHPRKSTLDCPHPTVHWSLVIPKCCCPLVSLLYWKR